MMLTKAVSPKTKAELMAALQKAIIRSVDVYEGERLASLPALDRLRRSGATVIVVY